MFHTFLSSGLTTIDCCVKVDKTLKISSLIVSFWFAGAILLIILTMIIYVKGPASEEDTPSVAWIKE